MNQNLSHYNPIEEDMRAENTQEVSSQIVRGVVAEMASRYRVDSDRLLGFALTMGYEEIQFTTCDPWKRKNGGISRNQFVFIKLGENLVNPEDRIYCQRIILARITDSVPTPVEKEIQNTIFQIHKMQPIVDPITQQELQWSALKARILGTFYDNSDGNIAFGNDVDTFFYPLAYEVYCPVDEDLSVLINSFVEKDNAFEIGKLRYTETPSPFKTINVPILVSVDDFIGKDYGHRTALFGKTRYGKSNTIKVIADAILKSRRRPGQIIFDPSGEYTYFNPQDKTSLFMLHREHCVRYSLDPNRALPPEEIRAGLAPPKPLKVNFYNDIAVGHSLITQLFETEFRSTPNYMVPILNWTPPGSPDEAPRLADDPSGHWHFWRTVSLWWGCLALAGYRVPNNLRVTIQLPRRVKEALREDEHLSQFYIQNSDRHRSLTIPVQNLPIIFQRVAQLWDEHKNDREWFPPSSSGMPYFNQLEEQMLKILKNDGSISGAIYLSPFRIYHDVSGSDIFTEIVNYVEDRRTVFIDFARANEKVREILSERIVRMVLDKMMRRFTDGTLGDLFVVLYFEEAHKLFPKEDRDLTNIYNVLAKEGAKFHISMIYATQSITTLSPDLLKNTENFIIGHLDDDREVREVTRKRAFRDMAEDVERIQSKGFVRMLTISHKFALPVQIRKFGISE